MQALTIIAPIAVALAASLGSYIVAARRFSGKVGSSEAAVLWKESASLRQWTADRMKEQDQLITSLRGRVADLEVKNTSLRSENVDLEQRVEACEKLGDEIAELTSQLEVANRRLAELGGGNA